VIVGTSWLLGGKLGIEINTSVELSVYGELKKVQFKFNIGGNTHLGSVYI
jgi:hypothetical protein